MAMTVTTAVTIVTARQFSGDDPDEKDGGDDHGDDDGYDGGDDRNR